MTHNKTLEELQAILDSAGSEILNASSEEIECYYKDLNINSDESADRLSSLIRSSMASFRLSKLKTARTVYSDKAHNLKPHHKIPNDSKSQRRLLEHTCSIPPATQSNLTLRYRDKDKSNLSDRDVKSTLEDLAELGALED